MDSRWTFLAGTACGVASVYLAQQGGKALQERRRLAALEAAKQPKQEPREEKQVKDGMVEPPPEHCPGVDGENAGKSDACKGCPNKNICASGAPKKDPAVSLIAQRLGNVKKKVLILSGKGGVGKSTVSAQLAFAFSRLADVGLLDIDICGPSAPRMLGLDGHEVHQSADGWTPVYVSDSLAVMSIGFMLPNKDDAIIWRGPKKNGLIKQFLTDVMWGPLDMLLVDTPPGTSDEHLSIVTYLGDVNVDGAIIVTTPQEVSLQDVRKEINFCKKVGVPIIGVIENMSGFICPGCNCSTDILRPSTGGAQQMCRDMDVHYLGGIPMDQDVVMAGETGKALGDMSNNPALLQRLQDLVTAINKRIAEMNALQRA